MMNKQERIAATKAIGVMLNCFPQSQFVDIEAQICGFLDAVDDISLQAVEQCCHKFRSGIVKDHNVDFAPSSARFALEARNCEELIKLKFQKFSTKISKEKTSGNVVYLRETEEGRRKFDELSRALRSTNPGAIDDLIRKYGYEQ